MKLLLLSLLFLGFAKTLFAQTDWKMIEGDSCEFFRTDCSQATRDVDYCLGISWQFDRTILDTSAISCLNEVLKEIHDKGHLKMTIHYYDHNFDYESVNLPWRRAKVLADFIKDTCKYFDFEMRVYSTTIKTHDGGGRGMKYPFPMGNFPRIIEIEVHGD